MTAIGYIRQSRRADLDVALSPEQQRRDIDTLAARDGVTVSAVYEDLGRSGGRGKERLRAGYQDVLAAIESGGATTIYTKTLTRLGRSVRELYRVLELCEAHGCRIVTMKEGVMDPRTPIGRAQFGMLAVFAEFERDLAVERARDNVASRRARGETMGRRTYGTKAGESPERVVAAYEEAGSFNGAAAILNRAGVRTVLNRTWSPSSIRILVAREAPGLIVPHGRKGAKVGTGFLFSGLLVCPGCRGILTAGHLQRGRYVRYHCHRAPAEPDHPRPYSIGESKVLPWLRIEAARLRPPDDLVALSDRTDEERIALEQRRERIRVAWVNGLYRDEESMAAEKAIVDEAITRLDLQGRVVEIPPVAWDRPALEVNRALRVLWDHVELDANLRPVRVEWALPPSWLGPRGDAAAPGSPAAPQG